MENERGCGGFFGFGSDFFWIIIILILVICFCPGIFGGFGGYNNNCKC
ncbi:MAG TPA: hypothetical protein PK566_02605 [Pseudobacteroides sp.]|nr:hypothetical protein [Pseudobacteroides sp.]